LHWLLKYLKARNVKDQFDNRFTSVPRYAGLLHTSEELDSSRSGTWQREEIRGMIRTLAVNHASIPVCSTDDGKTAAETSSEHMVKGTV